MRDARLSSERLQQPYVDAGTGALENLMALIGLRGDQAQNAAESGLMGSATYKNTVQAGEDAILANASATGGLRGGNTQNSLARFRADTFSKILNDQYGRVGNIVSLGQNAAAGVGNQGVQVAGGVADLLGQAGAATAGGQIANGNRALAGFNQGLQIAGAVAGF